MFHYKLYFLHSFFVGQGIISEQVLQETASEREICAQVVSWGVFLEIPMKVGDAGLGRARS